MGSAGIGGINFLTLWDLTVKFASGMDINEIQDYQYKHFKATVPERRVTVGVNEQLRLVASQRELVHVDCTIFVVETRITQIY